DAAAFDAVIPQNDSVRLQRFASNGLGAIPCRVADAPAWDLCDAAAIALPLQHRDCVVLPDFAHAANRDGVPAARRLYADPAAPSLRAQRAARGQRFRSAR